MKSSPLPLAGTLAALLILGSANPAPGATVTLDTLDRAVTVGQTDIDPLVAPSAPGDGWFAGPHAGTLRGRATSSFELRTQWYFVFDIAALAGVAPGDIVSATLTIPQIGRLNTLSYTAPFIKLYDPNFTWDLGGSNYPVFNGGRALGAGGLPAGYPGGTYMADPLGGYNDHGLVADTSNPDVEGEFIVNGAALLATVQSWAANPADNEGFFMTYENADNIGLAFGTPTLALEVIPEPATAGLLLLGVAVLARRRRA